MERVAEGGIRITKAQEETCEGDGYVIILNVVMISQEYKHQIVYFKHVQFVDCMSIMPQ